MTRRAIKLILNFIMKRGDNWEHDEASRLLQELESESSKSTEPVEEVPVPRVEEVQVPRVEEAATETGSEVSSDQESKDEELPPQEAEQPAGEFQPQE